jgi:hypothetical protein
MKPQCDSPVKWLVCVLCLAFSGCAAKGQPRPRLGSLPFPGPFTFFELADPQALGVHRYDFWKTLGDPASRGERGIVYTCRAGFLDLAHLRAAADWTRYATRKLRPALRAGKSSLTIAARDSTRYHIAICYPADWDDLPLPERRARADELAIAMGQRLSYIMYTWYEIATWFGYKKVAIFPEDASAFTYEDTISHLVGVTVAGEALRAGPRDYDEALTASLAQRLDELGIVSKDNAMRAVRQVEGHWWAAGESLKRHLDTGFDGRSVEPWLVPGFEPCGEDPPHVFHAPSTEPGMFHIEMESSIFEVRAIRSVLPGQPQRFVPERDFPEILRHIRLELIRTHGPDADRPDS